MLGIGGEGTAEEGDLVQALEKFWGASALAVKSVAAKQELQLEQHGGLWVFVNLLAKESGDKDIVGFFGEANALHRNFYDDEMEKESVEILAPRIEQLIAKLKGGDDMTKELLSKSEIAREKNFSLRDNRHIECYSCMLIVFV